MARTEVRNTLHVLIAIQGSTPAAHLDIAVAWSRVICNFVILAKGETGLLVAFFGSTCSIVASIISVIWKLIGKLCGPCHISVLESETKLQSHASATQHSSLASEVSDCTKRNKTPVERFTPCTATIAVSCLADSYCFEKLRS